jgi:hypothetical protein
LEPSVLPPRRTGPGLRGRGDIAQPASRTTTLIFTDSHDRGSFLRWLMAAVLAVMAVLGAVKLVLVRWRYMRRGPRSTAAAAFHELATFAGDQGVTVSSNLTFEDLAQRLGDTYGVDAGPFAACASAARYAPPREAERAGRRIRRQVRLLKRDIRRQLTARDRFTGAFRLRTALARVSDVE